MRLRQCLSVTAVICAIHLSGFAAAQSEFSPVVLVNEAAITVFEIDQRGKLLTTFGSTGDVEKQAYDALIDERLMAAAAKSAGIVMPEEAVTEEMDSSAQRAQITIEEFEKGLASNGIEFDSFREFVRARMTWRELVRTRFVSNVKITEEEVDRALALSGGGLRVSLSEIVLPVTDENGAQTRAFAHDIRQSIQSQKDFARAARRYSSGPTRGKGGKVDWINASNLNPGLSSALISMSPGDVSEPIDLPQSIVLLQMRALAEGRATKAADGAIDYMVLRLPSATQAHLSKIASTTDACADLWPHGDGLSEDALTRQSLAPAAIPARIRAELERLDANELSTRLTSVDGNVALVVMLCGRSPVLSEDQSREDVMRELRGQRIDQLAESYLAELRAAAHINEL